MTDPAALEVMFVDDEQAVLDGLRRAMRTLQPGWRCTFHADPVAAVLAYRDAMATLDAIVCDINMPQVNGLQLLRAVHERTPQTVRIALSGQLDVASMHGSARYADCHVCKPVRGDVLCATILEHWHRRHRAPPGKTT